MSIFLCRLPPISIKLPFDTHTQKRHVETWGGSRQIILPTFTIYRFVFPQAAVSRLELLGEVYLLNLRNISRCCGPGLTKSLRRLPADSGRKRREGRPRGGDRNVRLPDKEQFYDCVLHGRGNSPAHHRRTKTNTVSDHGGNVVDVIAGASILQAIYSSVSMQQLVDSSTALFVRVPRTAP